MKTETEQTAGGIVSDISQHIESVFRHMLPGALVIGSLAVAYPKCFCWVDMESWPHLAVLAVMAIVAGNTWFALNRYGVHQIIDYVFYLFRWNGPTRDGKADYIETLGKYIASSLNAKNTMTRGHQHVAFRASAVLLIFTLGELTIAMAVWHAPDSILSGHTTALLVMGVVTFGVGVWQMGITRRIDYYVVKCGNESDEY